MEATMKTKQILICDDDEGILDMLELILEEYGYTVIAEQNSLLVKAKIEQSQPNLVLLDLWMPVLSGDQVLRSIRKDPRTKNIPVIVISASREGREIAANAGASAFIAKPFDFDELILTVQKLIN